MSRPTSGVGRTVVQNEPEIFCYDRRYYKSRTLGKVNGPTGIDSRYSCRTARAEKLVGSPAHFAQHAEYAMWGIKSATYELARLRAAVPKSAVVPHTAYIGQNVVCNAARKTHGL